MDKKEKSTMQDEHFESYQSPNKDDYKTDPVALSLTKTKNTKSYSHLLKYAVPYTFIYVFMPYALKTLGVTVSGVGLSLLVVLASNILVIVIFKRFEKRKLEKIECHRFGLLTALITLIVTSVLMLNALYGSSITELTITALKKDGVIPMLVIGGSIGFAINYGVIFFGIQLLQKLWPQNQP